MAEPTFQISRRRGKLGFIELLTAVRDQCDVNREALLKQTNEIIHHLSTALNHTSSNDTLIEKAVFHYTRSFDRPNG